MKNKIIKTFSQFLNENESAENSPADFIIDPSKLKGEHGGPMETINPEQNAIMIFKNIVEFLESKNICTFEHTDVQVFNDKATDNWQRDISYKDIYHAMQDFYVDWSFKNKEEKDIQFSISPSDAPVNDTLEDIFRLMSKLEKNEICKFICINGDNIDKYNKLTKWKVTKL